MEITPGIVSYVIYAGLVVVAVLFARGMIRLRFKAESRSKPPPSPKL
jgi:NADH:ubiquinone oxidoreductase subunit 6 (subunit J)